MESLVGGLGEFWGAAGIVCGLQFLAIVYLYRAREIAQREHMETLRTIVPLAQKFTQTMDMVMPIIMAKINGSGK